MDTANTVEDMLDPVDTMMFMMEEAVWSKLAEGDEETSNYLADQLLLMPDLPMLLRARVLVCLSTIDDDFAVERAEEAVRILNVDLRRACEADGEEVPQDQLLMALRAVEMAMVRAQNRAGARAEEAGKEAGEGDASDYEESVQSDMADLDHTTEEGVERARELQGTHTTVDDLANQLPKALDFDQTGGLITPKASRAPSRQVSSLKDRRSEPTSGGEPLTPDTASRARLSPHKEHDSDGEID